jgi:P4 family phage/plasmid primase-like protien
MGQTKGFIEIATFMISRGIHVVPTYKGERSPLFTAWQEQATLDLKRVEEWITKGYPIQKKDTEEWYLRKVTPDHNCCAIGKFEAAFPIDIDDIKAAYRRGMPSLPITPMTETPSAGLHAYLRHTAKSMALGKTRNVFDNGVKIAELKGHNGGVCAPGCVREDGGIYKPVNWELEIAEAPNDLMDWIGENSWEPKVWVTQTSLREFHPSFNKPWDLAEHYEFEFEQNPFYLPDGSEWWVFKSGCPYAGREHASMKRKGNRCCCLIFCNGGVAFNCKACGDEIKWEHVVEKLETEDNIEPYPYVIYLDEDKPLVERMLLADPKFPVEACDDNPKPAPKRPTPLFLIDDGVPEDFGVTNPKKPFKAKVRVESWDDFPVDGSANKTDTGNGYLLTKRCGHDIRFVVESGWHTWDGYRWKNDLETVEMLKKAKSVVKSMMIEAVNMPEGDETERKERQAAIKWVFASEAQYRLEMMVKNAKSNGLDCSQSDFDLDPYLFNTMNGTVDLRTGEARDYERNDLISKISPIYYDPTADCPRWKQFMLEIMEGDPTKVDFLQTAAGYSMTGDTREECFFVLYGTGRNGKGKFKDMISHIMGDYGRPTGFDTFTINKNQSAIPTDIAALAGVRFTVASESEQSKRLAEAKIKQMTGRDKVQGCFKYCEPFEYFPQYKIWLLSNAKPRIVGIDNAIWDRVVFIPFNRYFAPYERDERLIDKLMAESSGILNWMIEGCRRWQKEGLVRPKVITDATNEYRNEQDVLSHFIDEKCIVEPGAEGVGIYTSYKTWAVENGEHVMRNSEFKSKLEDRGFVSGRTKNRRFWKGICLINIAEGYLPSEVSPDDMDAIQ